MSRLVQSIFLIALLNFSAKAQKPELILPVGHTEDIFSIQYSSGGKHILTCAHDNTAKVWDASSGKLLYTLDNLAHSIAQRINTGIITTFTHDGKFILAIANDNTLKKWETESGRLVYSTPGRKNKSINSVNISENFVLIQSVIKHGDGPEPGVFSLTEVINSNTGKLIYKNTNIFSKNQISSKGTYLLQFGEDNLLIKNVINGAVLQNFKSYNIQSAMFTPDEKYLVVFYRDSNNVLFRDIKSGDQFQLKLSGSLEFSRDSKFILATHKNRIKLLEFGTGNILQDHTVNTGTTLHGHFSNDGKHFFVSSSGRMIKGDEPFDSTTIVWDVTTGKQLVLGGDGYDLTHVEFSSDNKYIATISGFIFKLWNGVSGELIKSIPTDGIITAIQFSADDKNLIIATGKTAKVFNISAGEFLYALIGHSNTLVQAEFSSDNQYFITASNEKTVRLWNVAEGKIEKTFQDEKLIESVHLSKNGKYAVTKTNKNSVSVWQISTGQKLYSLPDSSITSMQFSNSSTYLITASGNIAKIWETQTGRFINELKDNNYIRDIQFSPDTKYAFTSVGNYVSVWQVSDARFLYAISYEDDQVGYSQFSPDSKYILTISNRETVKLWSTASGKLVKSLTPDFKTERGVSYISSLSYKNLWRHPYNSFSTDNNYLIITNNNSVIIWDVQKLTVVDTLFLGYDIEFRNAIFRPNSDLVITYSSDKKIRIWKLKTGEEKAKVVKTIDGNGFTVSPDGIWLLVVGNALMTVYDLSSLHILYKALAIDEQDYFIQLPDKLIYTATKNAAKNLSFRLHDKLFSFDQFDLLFNRPHEVMKAIGIKNSTLINAYKMAFLKRLQRSGFEEEFVNTELHIPELRIINEKKIPSFTQQPNVMFNFKAVDSRYKLDRYFIYVNEVALYTNGFTIKQKKVNTFQQSSSITLNQGLNKVQLSCMNEKGVESLKQTLYINYQPLKKPLSNICFIGIGVSRYKDSSKNLHYADKDIRDLAAIVRAKYPDALIDTFINTNATKENILAIKKKLMHTSVDDRVIVSISSHGLLDKNFNFYIATHDIDFTQPSLRGLSYEELEELLNSIPARKKLLLIDACHSGEIDTLVIEKTKTNKNLVVYKSKGATPDEESLINIQTSFELMKELFIDLSKGNGAVIISASGGFEFAFEDDQYSNGVFTYCIKKGLLESEADTNKNNVITVNELKEYVIKKVEELTSGIQKPTTRKENLEWDWQVW